MLFRLKFNFSISGSKSQATSTSSSVLSEKHTFRQSLSFSNNIRYDSLSTSLSNVEEKVKEAVRNQAVSIRNHDILNTKIEERWAVKEFLVSGTMSKVFRVQDLKTDGQAILKIGRKQYDYYFTRELSAYAWIWGHYKAPVGIAAVLYRYPLNDIQAYNPSINQKLILPLLGPTLCTLMKTQNGTISIQSTLKIGIQVLDRLQLIHCTGLVHRDIAPWNLLMGGPNDCDTVYLIDFGASQIIVDPSTRQHGAMMTNKEGVTRSPFFASSWSHEWKRMSKRDDLLSLGYVLVYLFTGDLPWLSLKSIPAIGVLKQQMKSEELAKSMPVGVKHYLNIVRQLQFDEEPDYEYLRDLFRKSLLSMGEKETENKTFDWG